MKKSSSFKDRLLNTSSLKSRVKEDFINSVLDGSQPITMQNAPELRTAIDEKCKALQINHFPELRLQENTFLDAMVLADKDIIILGAPAMHKPIEQQKSLVYHEFGHVILGHNDKTRPEWEHAADRIAVQMLGKHQPLSDFLHANEADRNLERAQFAQMGIAGRAVNWARRREHEKHYGTFAERIRNVETAPTEVTEELRGLIAKRNHDQHGMER